MDLEIHAFGHRQLRRKIRDVQDRAEDPRPAYMEAWARFRELESIQFAGQGQGPSGPWRPLKPKTILMKLRLGHDPRILHATFRLRNSLTRRGSRYGSFRMTREGAVFGSRHPAGKYHQQNRRGHGKIPRRPPIDLHEQDKQELVEIVRDYIMEGVV
jgi:phage gpG-like protein